MEQALEMRLLRGESGKITGFAIARIHLGTSSRFIPITTRRCPAVKAGKAQDAVGRNP
jgi:hypothetical protein